MRGVHILPIEEIVGLDALQETIELSEIRENIEIDLVTHDLKKFCSLLLKRNGYVLEQLYSSLIVYSTPEHQELKAIAVNCLTRFHSYHYSGFAKNQWQLLSKSTAPQAKPLLYLYRVLLTGIYLMKTGTIEANLVSLNQEFQLPYIPELIDLKIQGAEKSTLKDIDLDFHFQEYQRLQNELEVASQNSHLPDEPSAKEDLNQFLVRLRKSRISYG
nr:nucleotidyltransferase domain-containing protein [Hyella patelloides]